MMILLTGWISTTPYLGLRALRFLLPSFIVYYSAYYSAYWQTTDAYQTLIGDYYILDYSARTTCYPYALDRRLTLIPCILPVKRVERYFLPTYPF